MSDHREGTGPVSSFDTPAPRPLRAGAAGHQRALERFAPLLYDLMEWGLVHHSDDGRWVLREDVQARLDRTEALRRRSTAAVAVGRRCQACGTTCVTWMVDGHWLCSDCRWAIQEVPAPPMRTVESRRRRFRPRRDRPVRRAG